MTSYILDEHIFCTGSRFGGFWDSTKTGIGIYRFPNGTEYRGQFLNGQFHGEGTLIFKDKFQIIGKFHEGKCVSFRLFNPDELEYKIPWDYCQYPDRRYYPEIKMGLRPVGYNLLTKDEIPRDIPEGCYDIEEGFADPETGLVTSDYERQKPIRYLTPKEKEWMVENCRVHKIGNIGYNQRIAAENLECEKKILGCFGTTCLYDEPIYCSDEDQSSDSFNSNVSSETESCKNLYPTYKIKLDT